MLHKKQKDLKSIHGISVLDKRFKHLLTAALCDFFVLVKELLSGIFSAYTTYKVCINDNIVEKATTSNPLLKKYIDDYSI